MIDSSVLCVQIEGHFAQKSVALNGSPVHASVSIIRHLKAKHFKMWLTNCLMVTVTGLQNVGPTIVTVGLTIVTVGPTIVTVGPTIVTVGSTIVTRHTVYLNFSLACVEQDKKKTKKKQKKKTACREKGM